MQGAMRIVVTSLLLLGFVPSKSAKASDIVVPAWQVQVADAGFIGIADCVVAGGVVARYRVVESWKGPPAGSDLLIGRRVDTFGGQYPLALVGERYFFVVDSARGDWALPPRPGVGYFQSFPPWWRRIRPDFYAAYFSAKFPLRSDSFWGILDFARLSPHEPLDTFRVDVSSVLALDSRALEVETLRASARWFWRTSEGQPDSFAMPCTSPACVIVRSDSLEQVVTDLIRLSRDRGGINEVLYFGGRQETLRRLEEFPDNSSTVLPASMLVSTKRKIRVRLGLERPQSESRRFENETIDRKTHDRLLKDLRDPLNPNPSLAREAFERLTVDDPESIADFLVRWSPPPNLNPYEFGSYFAYRCSRNRLKSLEKLLGARDPFVRVAGAVYLTLENVPEGKTALEKFQALPGDAGAWAALTLARRGDKNAVPRALEFLRDTGGGYHREFQKRILELLSNSAAASDLQFPDAWNVEYIEQGVNTLPIFLACSAWWKTNADRVKLRDPWLDMLAAKKID